MPEAKPQPNPIRADALLSPRRLLALAGEDAAAKASLPSGHGVAFHSGRVAPGDVFFALPGAHGHGLAYAEAALAAGAAFVISDKPHPRGLVVADPAGLLYRLGQEARALLAGPVVAITGSAGKTSTKTMVAAALGAPCSPGNFNTPLALAGVLVGAALEHPRAPLVLELGIDHRGEMPGLAALVKPTHALLTLVAASHLSGLGSVEEVAREKRQLLEAAPVRLAHSSCRPHLGALLDVRFYGLDDETGALAPERLFASGCVKHSAATWQQLEVLGQRFTLPYPGRAMAANAVAALGLAALFGADLREAAARLGAVRLETGRLEVCSLKGFTLIDDSYNSNPASAEAALAVLGGFPRPHTAILGDMLELGERSAALHRALAHPAQQLDALYTVGDDAALIGAGHPSARHFARAEALIAALEEATLQGTVLVKASRGMRLERVTAALKARAETP